MPASTHYEEEAEIAVSEGEFAAAAGKRVLIVEDDASVAQYVAELLADFRCIVTGTAASGPEAVEIALATRPDLVLIDIGLRGRMDGIRTALELKSRLAVDTVFLSGSVDAVVLERARQAGPIDFIQKPFMPERLKQVLRKAFDHP
jgi:two-component system, response regulator PdtaR